MALASLAPDKPDRVMSAEMAEVERRAVGRFRTTVFGFGPLQALLLRVGELESLACYPPCSYFSGVRSRVRSNFDRPFRDRQNPPSIILEALGRRSGGSSLQLGK